MATYNNLYEYYTAQGQNLPSVQQRAPLYTQYGGTGTYTGTASQNNFLLSKLQSGSTTPTTTQNTNPVYTQGTPYYDTQTGENLGIVNYDVNTGAKLAPGATTQVKQATAPTSADQIQSFSSPMLPTTSPTSFGIAEATGSNTGMGEYFNILSEQQKTEDQIRQQIATSQSGKAESSFLSKILNRQSHLL